MRTLVFIGLLGVFSYHCLAIATEFKGASVHFRDLMYLFGGIGSIVFYIMTVICFWPYRWWEPIVMFAASTVIGGLTAVKFQKTLVGMFLSPVLMLIFLFLSCFGLYGMLS